MRRAAISWGVGVLLGGLLISTAAAQTTPEAKTFLGKIYAQYTPEGKPIALREPQAASIASPSLLALVNENAALLHGETDVLDADPLCVCQDYDNLKVSSINILKKGKGWLNASVTFSNTGIRNTVRFKLISVDHAWRIDDISNADVPSLRAALMKENGKHRP